MTFSVVVGSIKGAIKKIADNKRLNKNEFSQQVRSFAELRNYKASLVDKIIAAMPESDFCKIVEVDDCVVGKYHACTCTKIMVFGNDDVNGKVYEKFTTTTTSSRCRYGNLELAGKCMTTQEVGSCGEELIKAQQRNEFLAGKLKALYDIMGAPIDF